MLDDDDDDDDVYGLVYFELYGVIIMICKNNNLKTRTFPPENPASGRRGRAVKLQDHDRQRQGCCARQAEAGLL